MSRKLRFIGMLAALLPSPTAPIGIGAGSRIGTWCSNDHNGSFVQLQTHVQIPWTNRLQMNVH
jgi:hypothetical protein